MVYFHHEGVGKETIFNGVLSPRGGLGRRPYLMVYFHHEGVGKETIFNGVLLSLIHI